MAVLLRKFNVWKLTIEDTSTMMCENGNILLNFFCPSDTPKVTLLTREWGFRPEFECEIRTPIQGETQELLGKAGRQHCGDGANERRTNQKQSLKMTILRNIPTPQIISYTDLTPGNYNVQ